MAFITYDDIASSLPAGHDPALATRLLSNIEADLQTKYKMEFTASSDLNTGLVFDSYSEKAILKYKFIKTITSLKLKSKLDSSEETLVEGEDYRLIEVPNVPNTYYAIELVSCRKYGYKYPYYLELIGTKGYQTEVQPRIKNAIIDFLWKQLSLYSLDSTRSDRFITRAKTGESDIQFGRIGGGVSNQSFILNSAIDDSDFIKVVKRYLPPAL